MINYTTAVPFYNMLTPLYKRIDDVLRGEEHIKSRGQVYLPYTSGLNSMRSMLNNKSTADFSFQDIQNIYRDLLLRAQFNSWGEEALVVIAGLIDQVVPTPKLPEKLSYLTERAGTDGISLTELFQKVALLTAKYGKCTLVADVDESGEGYIAVYDAYSEYAWRYGKTDQKRDDLIMCAFMESVPTDPNDPFDFTTTTQYRIYTLDKTTSKPKVMVGNGFGAPSPVLGDDESLGVPTKPINYLPIVRVGALTNNANQPTNPPLLPVIRHALKAYVLSADYNSALHRSCHPQLYVTGVDSTPMMDNMANTMSGNPTRRNKQLGYTGAGTVWTLPNGSVVGYAEPEGTGMTKISEEIKNQKASALEAGARVLNIGVESGDARKSRQNDQFATLFSIVKNTAKAIEQVLRFIYQLTVTDQTDEELNSIQFDIPNDFGRATIDATLAAHLMSSAERGACSFDTYWTYIATGKTPERSFEQERNVMSNEDIELKPITGMVQTTNVSQDKTPKDAKAPEVPKAEV